MVRPCNCVTVVAALAQPHVAEKFAEDPRVAHGPASARLKVAGSCPVVVVPPAHAGVIDGGMPREVVDQLIGGVEGVATFDDAVARKGEDAGGAAAATVVVAEPGRIPRGSPSHEWFASSCLPGPSRPALVIRPRRRKDWASPAGPLHQP